MVFVDISDSNSKQKNQVYDRSLTPQLRDRFFATFLDVFLHIPIFYFLLAGFFRKLNIIDVLVVSRSEYLLLFVQTAVLLMVSSSFLAAIYLKILGATPGKILTKIKVVGIDQDTLTWGQALLRSFFWWFEMLLLGIPFLEILSHGNRRAMHDRVAETFLITLKGKEHAELAPLPMESVFVRSLILGFFFTFMGWMSAWLTAERDELVSGEALISEMRDRGLYCKEVDEIAARTNYETEQIDARLEFATALFLLDQVDTDCLEREVDLSFLRKDKVTAAQYLGRYLLESLGTERKEEYAKKTCQTSDSESCRSLQWLQAKNLQSVEKIEPQGLLQSVVALKQSVAWGNAEKALSYLEEVQGYGLQATALVREQVQIMSDLGRWDEVRGALSAAKSVVDLTDLTFITAEVCLQNLQSNCGAKHPVCDQFKSLLEKNTASLAHFEVARAVLKNAYCSNSLNENLVYWPMIEDESLAQLMESIYQVKEPKWRLASLSRLRTFAEDKSLSVELRYDALQVLLSEQALEGDWTIAQNLWSELRENKKMQLSSTRWMVEEARRRKKLPEVLALIPEAEVSPVLKFDIELAKSFGQEVRIPASIGPRESSPGIQEKK